MPPKPARLSTRRKVPLPAPRRSPTHLGLAAASFGAAEPDLREAAEAAGLRALPFVLALRGATPTASYSLRRSQELLLDLVALPYTSCRQGGRQANSGGRSWQQPE